MENRNIVNEWMKLQSKLAHHRFNAPYWCKYEETLGSSKAVKSEYYTLCMHVCVSVCLSVCMYVCMFVCMYVYTTCRQALISPKNGGLPTSLTKKHDSVNHTIRSKITPLVPDAARVRPGFVFFPFQYHLWAPCVRGWGQCTDPPHLDDGEEALHSTRLNGSNGCNESNELWIQWMLDQSTYINYHKFI